MGRFLRRTQFLEYIAKKLLKQDFVVDIDDQIELLMIIVKDLKEEKENIELDNKLDEVIGQD